MKQISLHVYQSIDGCPAPSDKHFDAAVDASSCVLIDEETYLRIYMNHLGWPITAKESPFTDIIIRHDTMRCSMMNRRLSAIPSTSSNKEIYTESSSLKRV